MKRLIWALLLTGGLTIGALAQEAPTPKPDAEPAPKAESTPDGESDEEEDRLAITFKKLDADNNGHLSEEELYKGFPEHVSKKERGAKSDLEAYWTLVMLDTDGTNSISRSEFARIQLVIDFPEVTEEIAEKLADKILELGDLDESGSLSRDEYTDLHPEPEDEEEEDEEDEFTNDDLNQDGNVDRSELIAGLRRSAGEKYEKSVKRCEDEFERDFDLNADQQCPLDEFKKAMLAKELGGDLIVDMYVHATFLAIDTDDDEVITPDEYVEWMKYVRGHETNGELTATELRTISKAVIARLDTNKEGTLDIDEIRKGFGEDAVIEAFDTDENDFADEKELDAFFKRAWKGTFEFVVGDGTDPYALYRVKGRSWLVKNEMSIGGNKMVTYVKTEVVKVTSENCTIKTTMLKDDKTEMMPGFESEITFATAEAAEGSAPEVDLEEETITVEAGKFLCFRTENNDTKVWSSKEFPGLTVKFESDTMTMELIEFNEFPKESDDDESDAEEPDVAGDQPDPEPETPEEE